MISVCLATYNGERFIRQQLASILLQLMPDDELIISDDSSTDRTLDAINEFDDPRIRLFSEQTFHSPIFNFEFALMQSRGDIVVLSDQDDIWLPHKLSTVRDYFTVERARPCLIVMDAEVVDDWENVLFPSLLEKVSAGPGFWRNIFDNRYMGCNMAFSRDLLQKALPFPRRIPMHDMWLGQLCERVGKTEFLPVVTMKYRKHGKSLTDFKIKFQPVVQIMRRLFFLQGLISRLIGSDRW